MYLNRMSYYAFNADNYIVLSVECNFISICYPPSFFVVAVVESLKIKTYPCCGLISDTITDIKGCQIDNTGLFEITYPN